MVRSVGFFNNDQNIVSTSLEGEITIFDAKTGDVLFQEQILGDNDAYQGNIAYCVRPFRKIGDGVCFMTTHADCVSRTWEFNPDGNQIKMMNTFIGHSNTVRYCGKSFLKISI